MEAIVNLVKLNQTKYGNNLFGTVRSIEEAIHHFNVVKTPQLLSAIWSNLK